MKLNKLLEAKTLFGKLLYKDDYDYSHEQITSLMHGPTEVKGSFFCNNNQLSSLMYGPTATGSTFDCSHNNLTTLKHAPLTVGHNFDCSYNKLTALELLARQIDYNFKCEYNKLTSLQGIHKQIKQIGNIADFRKNTIKSHVLGLIRIERLKKVFFDDDELTKIINKHLQDGRDVMACQDELIDAGLDEYAQL
jgi:hypothetical protein